MTEQEVRDTIVDLLEAARQRGELSWRPTTPVSETDHVICIEPEEGDMFFLEVIPA